MSAASFDDLGTDLDLGSAVYRDEDFPGCESFRLPASEIDRYEGRLEFRDGYPETAWKVPETPLQVLKDRKLLAQFPIDLLMAAAVACTGKDDIQRRIATQRGLRSGLPPHPGPDA